MGDEKRPCPGETTADDQEATVAPAIEAGQHEAVSPAGVVAPRAIANSIRLLLIDGKTTFAQEQKTILWAAAMILEEVSPSSGTGEKK